MPQPTVRLSLFIRPPAPALNVRTCLFEAKNKQASCLAWSRVRSKGLYFSLSLLPPPRATNTRRSRGDARDARDARDAKRETRNATRDTQHAKKTTPRMLTLWCRRLSTMSPVTPTFKPLSSSKMSRLEWSLHSPRALYEMPYASDASYPKS